MFKRVLLAVAACAVLPVYAGVNSWTAVGPDGGSAYGGVRHLARANAAVVMTTQGLHRTTDNGATWTRTFEFVSIVYGGLVANPSASRADLVLAHGDGSLFILRSADGGATWTRVTVSSESQHVSAVAFSRDGDVAWAGKADGTVYRSTDGGLTWTPAAGGLTTTYPISQLETDATDPLKVYLRAGLDVWRTVDGGANWARINGADTYTHIAASRMTHDVLLAVRFPANSEVFRSVDGGASFAATGLNDVTAIGFDPVDAGRVIAIDARRRAHASSDDGQSWTPAGHLPPGTPMQVSIDPTAPANVLVATNAGIAFSSDGGQTWVNRHRGIREALFGQLTVGRAPSNYVYAPSYDSNYLYRRDPSGQWSPIGAAADSVVLTTTDTGIVTGFAETTTSPRQLFLFRDGRLGRSDDDGASWQALGAVTDGRGLAFEPGNPLVAYVGNYNHPAAKTIDGGVTWSQLAGGLTVGTQDFLIDPTAPQTLYAARDAYRTADPRIFKSTDGGASWARTDIGITGDYIWRLVMHPGRPSTLFACMDTGLWVSRDSGASWSLLHNGWVIGVTADPESPDILYLAAGSPTGALRSVDSGLTWETLNIHEAGSSSGGTSDIVLVPGQPSTVIAERASAGLWEMEIAPDVRIAAASTVLVLGVPETVNYTLSNQGRYSATGITFSLSLPTATAVAVNGGNASCSQTGSSVSCSVPVLRPSASLPISLQLTPAGAGEELRAIASGYEPDSLVSNNVLDLVTQRRANLRAQVASSTDAAQTGNTFTYSLTATNLGPSPAANVVADLQLPANVAFGTMTATGLTCSHNAGLVRCTAAALALDASVSANVTVNASTAGAAQASLTVTGEGTDPDATNNVATRAVTLTDPPPPAGGSSSSSGGGSSGSSSSSSSSSSGGGSSGGGGGGGRLDYLLLALLGAAFLARGRVVARTH